MGLRDLKKTLGDMDKPDIIQLVTQMYKDLPDAKDYLDIFITGNLKTLIEKYKYEIEKYVYPNGREMTLREKEARKVIRKVRKMKITELNIELELHYVNCCMDIITDFGYSDENYSIAIEKMFESAVKGIEELGMQKAYQQELVRLSNLGYKYGLELEY